jgi:lysosomal alpha-mannosidase
VKVREVQRVSLSHEFYKQPQISFIPTSLFFIDWSALYKTQVESKIP